MNVSAQIWKTVVSWLLGVALAVVASVSLPAAAQPVTRLEGLEVRIDSLGCGSVDFDTLLAVRQRQPGYLIDYLAARCACSQANLKDLGFEVFCWLLDCTPYRIPPAARGRILSQATHCGYQPARTRITISAPTGVAAAGVAGIIVRSKAFHLLSDTYHVSPESLAVIPVTSSPIEVADSISLKQLAARVIPLDQFGHARERLSGVLPEDFGVETVETCEPFVLVSYAHHKDTVLQHVGRELVKVNAFYELTYELPPIEHAIVVYLLPDAHVLREFARSYHGLKVSEYCIGYSFPRDGSIVAVSPGSRTGTLKHELLHILLNPRFAGLPPWLEEGLASLYEESSFQDDRLLGVYGWRQRLMKEYGADTPRIEELLAMDEEAFNGVGHSLDEQAMRHAKARTLMLWIQERDRLTQVFAEFRPRCPLDGETEPAKEPAARLARILALPESELESKFDLWFRQAR